MSNYTVVGRVGSDPIPMHYESGAQKMTFSVAVDRTREITDWHKIECYIPRLIEKVIAPYVKKGTWLAVSGTLVMKEWEDRQTGETRSEPVLRCNQIKLGPRQEPKKGTYDR